MLADDMVQEPERRKTYLATLRTESDRLSRLVENVLCYSRLEQGRYRGRRERIAVDDLLARIDPTLRQRADEASLDLLVTSDCEATVATDPDAVAQILFNLVDNSAKYAAGADPATVEVTASTRDGHCVLTVRDHGPGIDEEHRGAIFRPFERGAHAAGDNAHPGVGLGLALARGLAEDLDGILSLRPTDRGTAFELSLPIAAAP